MLIFTTFTSVNPRNQLNVYVKKIYFRRSFISPTMYKRYMKLANNEFVDRQKRDAI